MQGEFCEHNDLADLCRRCAAAETSPAALPTGGALTTERDVQAVGPYWPPPGNPMGCARRLLPRLTPDGPLLLRHWRGGWWRWHGSCWSEVERLAVQKIVYTELENAEYAAGGKGKPREIRPWEPTKFKVSNVLEAMAALAHTAEDVDAPRWFGSAPVPPDQLVSCDNGLLHVGSRRLIPHAPDYFNLVAVPFAFDPHAPEPSKWLDFLGGSLWPNDPASVETLQEFFGYVLSGRTDLHKILLVRGPARSGKGTIARVLAALVGKGNAAGPTLASLGSNFGLAPLLGKPLAIVGDARLGRGDAHQVIERLLSISGEDMLTVDRKYREPWSGKIPARFLILTNELPRFGDASAAIATRFLVLTLTQSFLGREDSTLTRSLLTELPGILRWALDGLDRLARNGAFTAPTGGAEAVITMQDLASPVAAFVREQCEIDPSGEVPKQTLFTAYKTWCEDNGQRAASSQMLGRDLASVVPNLKTGRYGNAPRHYKGIRLRAWKNSYGDHGVSGANAPAGGPDSAYSTHSTHSAIVLAISDWCAVCGEPMAVCESGQTTHPSCDADDSDGNR